MKKIYLLILAVVVIGIGAVALVANGFFGDNQPTAQARVVATIQPISYFADRLLGQTNSSYTIVPMGANPELYELKPSQLQQLSQADVYFYVGELPFEKRYIPSFQENYPDLLVQKVDPEIEYADLPAHGHDHDEEHDEDHADDHHDDDEHGHEDESEHAEEEHMDDHDEALDPHTWLSPTIAQQQIEIMAETLRELYPEQADAITTNEFELLEDVANVQHMMAEQLAPLNGTSVMVYHPAFGYLFEEFGINQLIIEDNGVEPSLAEMNMLIDEAQEEGVTKIAVEPQFSDRSARVIAEELGIEVVTLDPLAYDYIANLQAIVATLTE